MRSVEINWAAEHPDAPRVSSASVNKMIGGIQAIVTWAREKGGMVPANVPNPFEKLRLEEAEPEGGPFEADELARLFGSLRSKDTSGIDYWLCVTALYTGMRRAEIMGLRASDITLDAGTGSHMIAVREHDDRRLKNKGSARTIPVHGELIRLGFLELAEAALADPKVNPKGWLFPSVALTQRGAANWSAQFSKRMNGLGLSGTRKGLHSLRHCFKDALRAGGVPEDLSDALTGHSGGGVGRSYGARTRHAAQRHRIIIERFGTKRMVEAIDTVKYPGLIAR